MRRIEGERGAFLRPAQDHERGVTLAEPGDAGPVHARQRARITLRGRAQSEDPRLACCVLRAYELGATGRAEPVAILGDVPALRALVCHDVPPVASLPRGRTSTLGRDSPRQYGTTPAQVNAPDPRPSLESHRKSPGRRHRDLGLRPGPSITASLLGSIETSACGLSPRSPPGNPPHRADPPASPRRSPRPRPAIHRRRGRSSGSRGWSRLRRYVRPQCR